jgi:predicted homoserine dehydrogenase-like protein
VAEVVAHAKRDLAAGDVLDGIGGFMAYGLLENTGTARLANLLPVGLSEGAVLVKPVPEDTAITFDDVALRPDRLATALWYEQAARFGSTES